MADFIAENFIIIVIIIGGLLSLLKNKSISDDDEHQQTGNRTASQPQKSGHTPSRRSGAAETSVDQAQSSSYDSVSIGEQQQKQMEELRKRMGSSSKAVITEEGQGSHEAGLHKTLRSPEIQSPYHHSEFKKEIKSKLNQKGLIDSIVMAEILGPPRAKKPYRSIINNRK
ncbi:MAG TPA: hypothetical protein VK111_13970 [Virgibacillus sp.]|nr:hypothetical protein [Virgibacillus sp.]